VVELKRHNNGLSRIRRSRNQVNQLLRSVRTLIQSNARKQDWNALKREISSTLVETPFEGGSNSKSRSTLREPDQMTAKGIAAEALT